MNDSAKLNMAINAKAAQTFVQNKLSTFGQRIGIKAKPTAPLPTNTAPVATAQSSASDPRPYAAWTERFGSNLNPKTYAEIYNRRGNPTVIEPDERKALKKIQQRDDQLSKQVQGLTWTKIASAKKESAARLKRGRGSAVDASFEKGNLQEVRKATKRERHALRESAAPILIRIAQRIEALARQTLPVLESEAARLGIEPGATPLVRTVAAACWKPSVSAAFGTQSPKVVLRGFGLKL